MKKENIILNFIFIIVMLFIITLHFLAASYSVLSNDDFLHNYQMITNVDYVSGHSIRNALMYTSWHYFTLGGQFFSMFLQSLFGANRNINMLGIEKIFMVSNALLYFISLLWFVYEILNNLYFEKLDKNDRDILTLFVYVSFIFVLHGFNFYYDVFTWFAGAVCYTIPMSIYFLSISLYFYNRKKNNIVIMILGMLLSALAMGGNISISIFAVSISTIIGVHLYLEKKLDNVYLVQYIQYFLFMIINAISSGNVNRAKQNLGRTAIDVITPLYNTMMYLYNRLIILSNKKLLIVCIIIFAVIMAYICFEKKIITRNIIICWILFLIVPITSTFIVAYGYGKSDLGKSHLFLDRNTYDRISFLMDFSWIVIFFMMTILICYIVLVIINNLLPESRKKLIFSGILCLICILVLMAQKTKMKKDDFHLYTVYNNLQQNKYKNYYEKYKVALNVLERNRGNKSVDVEILKPIPCHMPFSNVGLDLYYSIENVNLIEVNE